MKPKRKQPETEKTREYPDLQIRAGMIETRAAEGDKPASVRMSVSSEEPVLTYAYYNEQWQRVYEILDHGAGCDMSRCKEGLVILDRHYGDQIGLMSVEMKDRKLGGTVSFCAGERAQNISKDAAAGLRRNVSVGYQVDASSYRAEGDKDGIPVVRAMSWMPYEASFEPVPADTTVGVNRAAQTNPTAPTVERKDKTMDPKTIQEMYELAARHGIAASEVSKLLAENKGIEALRALVIDKQARDTEALRVENEALKTRKPDATAAQIIPPIGGTREAEAKTLKRFSVSNICRAFAGEKVDIGFEREISDECAKLRGKETKGLIIPFAALSKRDLSVSGTSSATVATELRGDQFIDLLRTNYVIGKAGVQFMTGVRANLSIPKMTAGATTYHVSEGGDVTESTPTLGNVTGTPHTIGAIVDITRHMMEQSAPNADEIVSREIVQRVMRGVQRAVFAGTGADGEPSAITSASGINNPSVTTGTPTYAEILNFIGTIMADNAMADGQKWIMTGEVFVKLASTMRTATYGDVPVLDPASPLMLGRQYFQTEDVPANSLWFGDWSSVMIPFWGNGIEIASDSAKLFASGGVTLRALLDYDVMVRLGQALAYNTAVTS